MNEKNKNLLTQSKVTDLDKLNLFEPGMIILIPAALIALVELFIGMVVFNPDMSIIKFSYSIMTKYRFINSFMYIIILTMTFPLVLLLFSKYKISLITELVKDKRKVWKDVLFGVLAGILTFLMRFIIYHVLAGVTLRKETDLTFIIISIIALVFVSGFFKEIIFRGIPNIFLKDQLGEWKAFILGNICFAIVDWPNLGLSFIFGFIWYLFYRKRPSLIIPIIAHGIHNLIGILATAGLLGWIGIIPR